MGRVIDAVGLRTMSRKTLRNYARSLETDCERLENEVSRLRPQLEELQAVRARLINYVDASIGLTPHQKEQIHRCLRPARLRPEAWTEQKMQ